MYIDIFRPDFFEESCEIDYAFLEKMFKHPMHYAAKGRHSIRHILASSGRKGAVIVPVYACSSIPKVIRKSGNDIVFCDIDERDLNISVDAFKKIITTEKVSFLLVPSLYGNPADLEELEKICKENDIFMIDDAAQSFGAKIGDRYVGSFGNAGFFSFSPGKPLTASMGSYFWTENEEYNIDYKYGHKLLHKVAYEDFYYNRYMIYERGKYSPYRLLTYLNILLQRQFDILNDGMTKYEEEKIGRLIEEYKKGMLSYRNQYVDIIKKSILGREKVRVINCERGVPNNQKLVLVFEEKSVAHSFREQLLNNGIYTSVGYQLLSDSVNYSTAFGLKGRIVEVPIESSEDKMKYLKEEISHLFEV